MSFLVVFPWGFPQFVALSLLKLYLLLAFYYLCYLFIIALLCFWNLNHQNNVWNLFKVNNKHTRTTWRRSVVVPLFLLLILNRFHTHRSDVFVADLQQVNAGWVLREVVRVAFSNAYECLVHVLIIEVPVNNEIKFSKC